jgi:hypothetical protein
MNPSEIIVVFLPSTPRSQGIVGSSRLPLFADLFGLQRPRAGSTGHGGGIM